MSPALPAAIVRGMLERAKRKGRARPQPGVMNKQEASYALYLEALKAEGKVVGYLYEPASLKLAKATHYVPDFLVVMADGGIYLDDVKALYKGQTQPHVEDDSRVKIKIAADKFWMFTFRLVWVADGRWAEQEIG